MEHHRAADRQWAATPFEAIERSLFRNHANGGRSSWCAWRPAQDFRATDTGGSEEVLVLSGEVQIGEARMQAGDYLFTEPGEEHGVEALSDAVIFVSSQGPTPLVEDD